MPDTPVANPANPLGAGSGVERAVPAISAYLANRNQPKGDQPAEKSTPVQANRTEQPAPVTTEEAPQRRTPAKDPTTGKFTKEPGTTEDNPRPEGADVDETPAPKASADDHEELADTVEGLASQLGMEPDELANHLKAKIKVNGEERPATLKELIELSQKGEDYSRKTAKHAEEVRAFAAQQQALQQQREHIEARLNPFVQQLEQLVGNDDQRLQELLNAGDLLEYERLKWSADQRKQALAQAQREQQRIGEERQREARTKLEHDVAENELRLIERIPEWKNVEVGKRGLEQVRGYLVEQGVPADNARTIYDAASIDIARKAMLWDQLQKDKPGKLQEVKTVPKFIKPGPSQTREDPTKKVHRANLNRLKRDGSTKALAQVLISGGHVRPR
jgi:hypothetical protein